jgi:hypothetical protein
MTFLDNPTCGLELRTFTGLGLRVWVSVKRLGESGEGE